MFGRRFGLCQISPMLVGKIVIFRLMKKNLLKFFWRSSAFILDYSLASWPFYLLLSIPRFEYYQKLLDKRFIKLFSRSGIGQTNIELLSCWFMVLVISQFIRLYTTFFFGRSFGQIILGLKPHGSFWWVRIHGGLRILLETLLTPFLFGHLLILYKGRSLHEVLSGSTIKFKLFRFRPLAGIFAIIISFISFLFSPVALNISDYHHFKYVKTKIEPNKLDPETDFSMYQEMGSVTFGFSLFAAVDSNESKGIFILPSIDVKKVGKRLLKSPILYLIDRENGSIGKMTIELKFDVKNLLNLTKYANPLIALKYPALFQKNDKNETIDLELQSNQFVDLIDQIFNLQVKEIPSKVLGLGPILLGPAKLRRKILRFLSNTASVQVQRVKLNKDRFLRLQQLFDAKGSSSFPFQETFIALENLNGKVLQIKWGRTQEDAKAREKFQEHFLSTIGLIDTTWSERNFNLEQDWNSFDIIDGLMKSKLEDLEKKKLRAEILAKLLKSKLILKSFSENKNKKEFKRILLHTVNRFLFLQKNRKGHLTDPDFKKQLINLKSELLND